MTTDLDQMLRVYTTHSQDQAVLLHRLYHAPNTSPQFAREIFERMERLDCLDRFSDVVEEELRRTDRNTEPERYRDLAETIVDHDINAKSATRISRYTDPIMVEHALATMISFNPKDLKTLEAAASLARKHNQPDRARIFFERVYDTLKLRAQPNQAAELARIEVELGRYGEAVEHYMEAGLNHLKTALDLANNHVGSEVSEGLREVVALRAYETYSINRIGHWWVHAFSGDYYATHRQNHHHDPELFVLSAEVLGLPGTAFEVLEEQAEKLTAKQRVDISGRPIKTPVDDHFIYRMVKALIHLKADPIASAFLHKSQSVLADPEFKGLEAARAYLMVKQYESANQSLTEAPDSDLELLTKEDPLLRSAVRIALRKEKYPLAAKLAETSGEEHLITGAAKIREALDSEYQQTVGPKQDVLDLGE